MVLCALVPLGIPQHAHAERQIWVVRPGDALSLIAERFDCTVEEIQEWNELDNDVIQVGQRLFVAKEDDPGPTHRVAEGETLSHIAQRQGMDLARLLELNPDLNPDRIRVGQEIRLGTNGRHRVDHEIRPGDTLSRLAARYRVSIRDIHRWNPRLRANRLRVGRKVRMWSEVPESRSVSIGLAYRGSLQNAERLRRHPGYIIRDRNRAWGTLETVMWLVDGFDAVRDQFPGAPRVRVHDISRRNGGSMHGHRSHQSGRDVDISYYQRRCGGQPCAMRRLHPSELDVARQWALFESWLKAGRLEAIFMDYNLQEPLYNYARSHGATRQQLHRWFQYPRGRDYALGTIRHYPRHADHAHVRFVCPDTDPDCR